MSHNSNALAVLAVSIPLLFAASQARSQVQLLPRQEGLPLLADYTPAQRFSGELDWRISMYRAWHAELDLDSAPNRTYKRTQLYGGSAGQYVLAALSKEPEALVQAGCFFARLARPEDHDKARAYLQMAADKNMPEAKFILARYFATGIAGVQSDEQALSLFQEAANYYNDPQALAETQARLDADAKQFPILSNMHKMRRQTLTACGPDISLWSSAHYKQLKEIGALPILRAAESAN